MPDTGITVTVGSALEAELSYSRSSRGWLPRLAPSWVELATAFGPCPAWISVETQVKSSFGSEQERVRKLENAEKLKSDDVMDVAHHLRQVLDDKPDEFLTIAKQLGIARRKAYYYVEIDRAFAELQADNRRLNRVGWTKLRLISPHINARNCERLLKLAEENSTYGLARLMNNDEADAKMHAVLLHLTPEQYEVFRDVLEAHGAKATGGGLSEKEQALTKALRKLRKR
jgi:hypothetical protein